MTCKHKGAKMVEPNGLLYCAICEKKIIKKNIADLVKEFE